MNRKFASGVLCLLAYAGFACAQSGGSEASANFVMFTIAYVEQCVQTDALLRRTCARIGPHLSDKNKRNCALPSESFEARTARSYRAFRDAHRTEIDANNAKLTKLLSKTHEAFDRQFAQVRAGKVSMFDLESLSRELTDRCTTIEREWLNPNRNRR